jgi:hypothetical protein
LLLEGGQNSERFPLLSLANVPRTFAAGAVAGLVLARLGPLLRGDSATLKAVNISAVIMITSIAASLWACMAGIACSPSSQVISAS